MIIDLAPLRMVLDEWDKAATPHDREQAEQRMHRLLVVGLVKALVHAVDEPDRHDGIAPDEFS